MVLGSLEETWTKLAQHLIFLAFMLEKVHIFPL